MERSVEVLSAILFGVIGLSHLVQPEAWVELFVSLRGKREAGALVDGLLNLPLAAVIIAFHNIWSGLPLILTLVGWGLLIKSSLRLCLPQLGLRAMERVSMERRWEFQAAGAVLVVLAGVVGYSFYVA